MVYSTTGNSAPNPFVTWSKNSKYHFLEFYENNFEKRGFAAH